MQKQLKITVISDAKLSIMLKFIKDKHPEIKNDFMLLSLKIQENFNTYCPCGRIEEYIAKISFIEDFELEGRKIEYGHRM